MNEDIAYLLGMLRDGHISRRGNKTIIEFYQQNIDILKRLQSTLIQNFSYQSEIRKHKDVHRLRVFRKEVSNTIANLSRSIDFRKISWDTAKYFVAGYVDAEGSLLIGRRIRIVVTQADKEDLSRLSELIEENTDINCTKIQGPYAHKMSKKDMYYLVIDGKRNVEKFFKEIPVAHEKFLKRLREMATLAPHTITLLR